VSSSSPAVGSRLPSSGLTTRQLAPPQQMCHNQNSYRAWISENPPTLIFPLVVHAVSIKGSVADTDPVGSEPKFAGFERLGPDPDTGLNK
jgi:hypothetical protein